MNAISIQNITKFYGTQQVLDQVGFDVHRGEVVGLLGPNGAGKSTLMKILTAFIPPREGTAFVMGRDVQKEPLEIQKQIGYLPENNPLYPDMYVREYLAFVSALYPGRFPRKKRVEEVIGQTGLGSEQHKKIGALSKGYRQRVGLAQALIHDPPVLILDEPTTGLDPNQLTGIRQVIKELGKEKAVLFSTHIMQEVEAVCDRVVILNKGRVVADGPVETLVRKASSGASYFVELQEKIDPGRFLEITGIVFTEPVSETSWILHASGKEDLRTEIFNFVVSRGLHLLTLSVHGEKLEDVFRQLTEFSK
ncbi:MAG TPA: gliding motility-associated ABC transporter ATP-binding subunit GldA [Bacteroidetes bacterium]|nr:gliding motility-associated ABC transporter ATP-binding subunit GldA [Bacteroidota bacterium]